jgi:hypothetical protein
MEVSVLRARAAGQAVRMGGFIFNSYEELKLFVEEHVPRGNFGLFVDAVSLLHSIDASYVDPDRAVATEAARLKAQYDSQLEMKIASSFRTSYPAVMFRDSSSSTSSAAVAEGSLGPGMATIDKWDARDGVSGTKFVIQNGVRRLQDSIPFEIREYLMGRAAELAKECFTNSSTFVHHLNTFVDTFYMEMSNAAGFSKKEAWDLVTAVLIKIFSDLRDARALAQESREPSGFIWATLQAHMTMQRLIKHEFKRDPGLNAILVQFILKKKQTDSMAMLGGVNVKSLETLVKRVECDVATLKTKV